MSRLRQSVAVLLCLALALALPALCLGALNPYPGLSSNAACGHTGASDESSSMSGMAMPSPLLASSSSSPGPAPASHLCCAAHTPVALAASASPQLPGLAVAHLLAPQSHLTVPAGHLRLASLTPAPPLPRLSRTPLRI